MGVLLSPGRDKSRPYPCWPFAESSAFSRPTHSSVPLASLYVHVPFCRQRCVYCDYYFTVGRRDEAGYLAALAVEAEAAGRAFGRREPFETVYLGGGTPSVLGLDALARVLGLALDHFDVAGDAEITVELNPDDLDGPDGAAFARGLRALGVTRVSLGVQSFFDEDLRWMNRAHTGAQAEAATVLVAETFERFSVDLIFGRPGQPVELWGANLEKALRLGAPHVSAYTLTVEERTPLERLVAAGRVVPAGDEELRERYLFTHRFLEARGLEHYEVSSFARPGFESRHNAGYWTHRNVVGLGPSAHSFWRETRSKAWRWSGVANVARWQALLLAGRDPLEAREAIGADALADEAVMLGLRRLREGLEFDRMEHDYGVDLLGERAAVLAALEGAGLVATDGRRVKLTPEGATVIDAVALKLVG